MAVGEVDDVNVVADTGAVAGGVVCELLSAWVMYRNHDSGGGRTGYGG